MFSIDELRRNYECLADDQIVKLATGDAKTLTEEAVIVLKEHIKKRQLGDYYIQRLNHERNLLSKKEKEEVQRIIKHLPCPKCGDTLDKLIGHSSVRRTGLIIFYIKNEKDHILCPTCGKQTTINDTIYSLFMGWWSVKSVFFNLYDIGNNIYKSYKRNKIFEKLSEELIFNNTGYLRENNCSKDSIEHLLKELYMENYKEIENEHHNY